MPIHDIGGRAFAGLSTDTKPSLEDGWLFFETDTQDIYQRLAGAWTRIQTRSPVVLFKSADEIVNNSSTMQDDDHFSFAVAPNDVWIVQMYLDIKIKPSSDFKSQWLLPSGSKFYQMRGWRLGTLGLERSAEAVGIMGFAVANDVDHAEIHGILRIGGTGGTAQWQWAQTTPVAEDTILEENSFMVAIKQ